MQKLIGSLLLIAGAALGIYVGFWLMLTGGIVDIIEAVRATELIAIDVAVGVAKVVFCGVGGSLAALPLAYPGLYLMGR